MVFGSDDGGYFLFLFLFFFFFFFVIVVNTEAVICAISRSGGVAGGKTCSGGGFERERDLETWNQAMFLSLVSVCLSVSVSGVVIDGLCSVGDAGDAGEDCMYGIYEIVFMVLYL